MDPLRVKAYLQAACAGLGFDIGEVWWTSNEMGSSTVASIDERECNKNTTNNNNNDNNASGAIRFLQLYTSKSYDDQRCNLLVPPCEQQQQVKGENGNNNKFKIPSEGEDNDNNGLSTTATSIDENKETETSLNKHALSPALINAISTTTQVVWANAEGDEGLLGRSDVCLHTAIAMPVATDENGNMCIVVMFSKDNVESSDDAMEYLQYISKSAASTIPCLLPVVPNNAEEKQQHELKHDEAANGSNISHSTTVQRNHENTNTVNKKKLNQLPSDLHRRGVTARFVSFKEGIDDNDDTIMHDAETSTADNNDNIITNANAHSHELSAAPKDCFGIPMLPSASELAGVSSRNRANQELSNDNADGTCSSPSSVSDAFDEASYGVWSTVMNNPLKKEIDINKVTTDTDENRPRLNSLEMLVAYDDDNPLDIDSTYVDVEALVESTLSIPDNNATINKSDNLIENSISASKRERLEEFATAFLGMSVFDVADVWMPLSAVTTPSSTLFHVMSVTASNENDNVILNAFKHRSSKSSIKMWSGAVGRAFGSGNPVWSYNQDVIVDSDRVESFEDANIQTVLAVPVFPSGKHTQTKVPACVVACYALVRMDSVPFVLRFVQQALRLVWDGLDQVAPHASVSKSWKDVAPAHLGEMAADLEMQHAFVKKKRPFEDVSSTPSLPPHQQLHQQMPFEIEPTAIQNVTTTTNDPQICSIRERSAVVENTTTTINMYSSEIPTSHQAASFLPNPVPSIDNNIIQSINNSISNNSSSSICYSVMQDHVQEAVKSLGQAAPWELHHLHQNINDSINRHEQQRQHQQQQHNSKRIHMHNTTSSTFHGSLPPAPTIPQPRLPTPFSAIPSLLPTPQYQVYGRNIQLTHVNHSLNNNDNNTYNNGDQVIYSKPIHVNDLGNANSVHSLQQIPHTQQVTPPVAQSTQLHQQNPQYCVPVDVSSSVIPNINPTLKHNSKKANSGGCRIKGCKEPNVSRRPYCTRHSGNRLCEFEGCGKCAQGSTRFCIAHGGGRRCTFPGCDKGARDKFFCAAHGGGKRCNHPDCNKSAVGASKFCTSHGGGKRCAVSGCDKSAQSSTLYCVKHGGGKKCSIPGCGKVARGKTLYCASHGGGIRCRLDGCNRVAVGRLQLCRIHGNNNAATSNEATTISSQPKRGGGLVGGVNASENGSLQVENTNPSVKPYVIDITLV